MNWRDSCEVILFWSEVKWVTVEFLGIKVPCTLGWPNTGGTWLYCDYFTGCILYFSVFFFNLYRGCFNLFCNMLVCVCVFCNVWVCVCVGFVMCGCFGNMYICIYCVFVLFVLFLLFRLCIIFLICFVCASVRTTATEW